MERMNLTAAMPLLATSTLQKGGVLGRVTYRKLQLLNPFSN